MTVSTALVCSTSKVVEMHARIPMFSLCTSHLLENCIMHSYICLNLNKAFLCLHSLMRFFNRHKAGKCVEVHSGKKEHFIPRLKQVQNISFKMQRIVT